MSALAPVTLLRELTLEDLWAEAETLGFVRVWTRTDLHDTKVVGYQVRLLGRRRNTKLEIERDHTSLKCALADAINEAREMGLGEKQ
jgi:hypothetical protein